MEQIVLGDDWRVFEHSSPLASELAFRWALQKIRPRYRLGGEMRLREHPVSGQHAVQTVPEPARQTAARRRGPRKG
jgi:hypothetical protein